MAEQMRALGYLCPECGKIVYGERTRFAMSAAAVGLVCGCGRSELTAQPEGASCRLTVPCGLCGGEHRAEAAAERLLEGEGVALPFREPEENRVWQALQSLGEDYRLPLYLFYFEELPTDRIAKVLALRPGAVRMRLSRGRDQLRELLTGDYFDEE